MSKSISRKGSTNVARLSPALWVTILVAILGALATAASVVIQGRNQLAMQETEHDTAVLLQGLSLKTNEERRKFLHFAAELGLFNDAELTMRVLDTTLFPSGVSVEPVKQVKFTVSKHAIDLLTRFEAGSRTYYEQHLSKPHWPGGDAGLTIGIGYDLGYSSVTQFTQDWGAFLEEDDIEVLSSCIGKKGRRSNRCLDQSKTITIPYAEARSVFVSVTVTYYAQRALTVYPEITQLPPDAQGAVLSLVMNRGTKMSGDTRKEMRDLQKWVELGDLDKMATSIRSMKRLWEGRNLEGIVKRREKEAELLEGADREYKSNELIDVFVPQPRESAETVPGILG